MSEADHEAAVREAALAITKRIEAMSVEELHQLSGVIARATHGLEMAMLDETRAARN